MSAHFSAKNFGFFEIYGASHEQGEMGRASVDILGTRGMGS